MFFSSFTKKATRGTVETGMKSRLQVVGRDEQSWEEAKPILIAALLKTTGSKRVAVRETYLKIELELPFHEACKGLDMLLHYFRKEYKGIPINFSLEVNASQQWQ